MDVHHLDVAQVPVLRDLGKRVGEVDRRRHAAVNEDTARSDRDNDSSCVGGAQLYCTPARSRRTVSGCAAAIAHLLLT